MASITLGEGCYQVGKDFVDAVAGTYITHGRIGTSGSKTIKHWLSTLSIAETERLFRLAVKTEGLEVNYFESQVIS